MSTRTAILEEIVTQWLFKKERIEISRKVSMTAFSNLIHNVISGFIMTSHFLACPSGQTNWSKLPFVLQLCRTNFSYSKDAGKWSVPGTSPASNWFLFLSSTRTSDISVIKWSTYLRSLRVSVSIEPKSVSGVLWVTNYYLPYNPSHTDRMWQASHCFIDTSMESTRTKCIP